MEVTDQQEVIVIRPYEFDKDAGLIFSSWRSSVWWDSHTTDKIEKTFFNRKTHEIKKIIADPETIIKIACLKSNKDEIIGYVVINRHAIHFVYVKLDYRKQGVASILCKGLSKVSKPTTKVGASIVRRLNLEVQENVKNGRSTNAL